VKILAIGIATHDVVYQLDAYPAEDDEVRALSMTQRRGGNATNTLAALSQLGHSCYWAGTLVENSSSALIRSDLDRFSIDTQFCKRIDKGVMPSSHICISQSTSSRTIVHFRDLPEFSFQDFSQIDLAGFDWVHFEGRNIPELRLMLESMVDLGLPISLEIEKPREDIESLFHYADLLLFSRQYARAKGYKDAQELLQQIVVQGRDMTCTWGDAGAWGKDRLGQVTSSPAYPQQQVVDTIGAGDVFNAGMIDACLTGLSLEQAIDHACQLAGSHCSHQGFGGLA